MWRVSCLSFLAMCQVIIAFASAQLGTTYDPSHSPVYPLGENNGVENADKLSEAIAEDFGTMVHFGFKHIRTFYSQNYGHNVADIAAKYQDDGLQLYLGVAMSSNILQNEIDAAVTAANLHGGLVRAIIVGSENLQNFGNTQSVVDAIKEIKGRLNDKTIPVGTSQRINEWLKKEEIAAVAEVCDFVGVTIYPFFTNGWNRANPVDLLQKQYDQVQQLYEGKPIWVTETGYPSAGARKSGSNTPGIDDEMAYFNGVKEWSGLRFWFSFFDRRLAHPIVKYDSSNSEAYFGLMDCCNRTAKFDLGLNP